MGFFYSKKLNKSIDVTKDTKDTEDAVLKIQSFWRERQQRYKSLNVVRCDTIWESNEIDTGNSSEIEEDYSSTVVERDTERENTDKDDTDTDKENTDTEESGTENTDKEKDDMDESDTDTDESSTDDETVPLINGVVVVKANFLYDFLRSFFLLLARFLGL